MIGFVSADGSIPRKWKYQGLEVVKLHAEWLVCTFLARSRNCIMLWVAIDITWKSNLYGLQKNLYWSVISINIHYQMHLPKITRTPQVIREASIGIVDWLNTSWQKSFIFWDWDIPPIVRNMLSCHMEYFGWPATPHYEYMYQWYHMWVLVDLTVKDLFWLILFIIKHPAKTMHVWPSFRK